MAVILPRSYQRRLIMAENEREEDMGPPPLWKLEVPFEQLANAWYMAEIVSLETVYYGVVNGYFVWFTKGGISDMDEIAEMCKKVGVIITDVSDDAKLQSENPYRQWGEGL